MSGDYSIWSYVLFLLAIVAGLFVYLLPSVISSGKKNDKTIFWVNLLLGWTALVWIICLIWALVDEREGETKYSTVKADKYDQLTKLEELRGKGVITTEEFIIEKEKIMKS